MMNARTIFMTLLTASALVLTTASVHAAPGNADNAEPIYVKRCLMCHGEEGDGLGPAAERLNPPPRDFTLGQYKFKTTAFDDDIPNDDDIFRMIRDGMPGTAMPSWKELLNEQEMWDLVAYVKTFGEIEDAPEKQIDFGTQVASSVESIEKGSKLFHDGERCSECHGQEGKGDGIKKLKGDNGERTWPRNLTKPWTFRASSDPKDIFARISTGIPGTQMPNFANPKSNKKLSTEDRWDVANYVVSLAKTERVVRPENTVIKADRLDGELPTTPDDAAWDKTVPTTFLLVPQIIAKERFFMPSNDTITARALYNDKELALLVEWDDRTKSIPGDANAEKISDKDMAPDMVAVQLPLTIPTGMQKPYFGMGDAAHPVNLWQWSGGTTDESESIALANAKGFGKIETRDAASVGLSASSSYSNGTWKVVMKRPLVTEGAENDIQFEEGRFTPIAFSAWDGSNSEKGSKHTLTTWYWLLLKPPTGTAPLITGFIVFIVLGGGLVWWARTARKPEED